MPNTGLDSNYFSFAANATAVHSFGVAAFVLDWIKPTPPALDPAQILPMMRSCTFSNHQFSKLDITHLFSPDRYKEYMPGFGDGGQLQMNFLYSGGVFNVLHNNLTPQLTSDAEDAIVTAYYWPRFNRYRLHLVDPYGSTLILRGFFQPPTQETGEDSPLLSSVTFEVSGKPKYVKYAPAP